MNTNKQKVWFTSDTHFGHNNIIKYSRRPYRDKHEMDEAIIENWNSRVRPDDVIYHLGDVFFTGVERAIEVLNRLNGQKFLVLGNHDKVIKQSNEVQSLFTSISDYREITVEGQAIVLSHYPMMTWNKSGRGSWMLHGHCHGNLKYPFEAKIHDVGVDPNGYFPISFQEIQKIMSNKKISIIDHHSGDSMTE